MRSTQTCPKCSGKVFVVLPQFQVQAWPMAVPAVMVNNAGDLKTVGTFETWICAGCGYTELYARDLDLDRIATFARVWPEQVRIVDAGPAAQGPYR